MMGLLCRYRKVARPKPARSLRAIDAHCIWFGWLFMVMTAITALFRCSLPSSTSFLQFVPSGDWDFIGSYQAFSKLIEIMQLLQYSWRPYHIGPWVFGIGELSLLFIALWNRTVWLARCQQLSGTVFCGQARAMYIQIGKRERDSLNPRARVIYWRFRTACTVAFTSSFSPPVTAKRNARHRLCQCNFVSDCHCSQEISMQGMKVGLL